MLSEARARARARSLSIELRVGDVARLPLEDGEIGACRADTLLQHLVDPAAAVREMARVTRPGGRLALLEFDLGTMALDHPDRPTTAAILETLIAMAADGWAGRGLRRLLVGAGLTDVRVDMQAVRPDHGFLCGLLGPAVAHLGATQAVATTTLGRWWASLERSRVDHTFTACATVFIAGARVSG